MAKKSINNILMCLYYVKEDLIIHEITNAPNNCIYLLDKEGYSHCYECNKLIDNYVCIINGETPKHYLELYNI